MEEKVTMDDYADELEASFCKVQEGDVLTGTVIGISETEVTLDLKYYTEGIIRLSDYSEDPSFSLRDQVSLGDEVTATVLRTDDGHGHILLSRKAAAAEMAWKKLEQYLEDGTVLDVKVGGVVKAGVIAYVEGIRGFIPASRLSLNYVENLEDWLNKDLQVLDVKVGGVVKAGVIAYVEGIRGFIPASRLSLNYVENLEDWLNKDLQVQVITVDPEKKKLVLSARELLKEKAAEERRAKISNVEVGLVTEGVVESIQPYGAFIDLGDGLSGLVHVSQISDKRIKSPDAVLKTGDKVKVKVIAIKDGKLSLSMKALKDVAAEEVHEENIVLPETEELTTTLGDLFKNIKL